MHETIYNACLVFYVFWNNLGVRFDIDILAVTNRCVALLKIVQTIVFVIYLQTGEIVFLDPEKQKCCHRTQVTGHVTRLEVIPDDLQHVTYLLVCGSIIGPWSMSRT